jgi:hypothetical protein
MIGLFPQSTSLPWLDTAVFRNGIFALSTFRNLLRRRLMLRPTRHVLNYYPGKKQYLTYGKYPFGHMITVGDWFEFPLEIMDRVQYAVKCANEKFLNTPLYFIVESSSREKKAYCIQIGKKKGDRSVLA